MSTTQATTTTPYNSMDETANSSNNNTDEAKLLEQTVHRAQENLSQVRVLVYRYFCQAVKATQLGLSHARQVIHEATKFEQDDYEKPPQLQECDASESSSSDHDDDDSLDVIPVNKKYAVLNKTVNATKATLHSARRAIYNATKSAEEKEQERALNGGPLSEQEEAFIQHKLLLNKAILASKGSLVRVRNIVHKATEKGDTDFQKEMRQIRKQMQQQDADTTASLLVKAVDVTKSRLEQVREVIHDATKPTNEKEEDENDKDEEISLEEVPPAENLFHSPHPVEEKKTASVIIPEVLPLNITDNAALDGALSPKMAALYEELDENDAEEKQEEKEETAKADEEEQAPVYPSSQSNDGETRLAALLHAMD